MEFKKICRREEGAGLAEVVASLLILSVISLTLMGILTHAVSVSEYSNTKLAAMHLAKLILREYQGKTFDELNQEKGEPIPVDLSAYIQNIPEEFDLTQFQAEVLVSSPSDSKLANKLLTIEVTVKHNGQSTRVSGYKKADN